MQKFFCDGCKKEIENFPERIRVQVQKRDMQAVYDCCSVTCASEVFKKLYEGWSCNQQSNDGCYCSYQ